MENERNQLIKHREVRFCTLHPDKHQAHSATLLLTELAGVIRTQPLAGHVLSVTYDITAVTLQVIEESLAELGYHLDNSLMTKLKRALYYYTEETQRANLGVGECGSCTQVFVKRYERMPHGCRDERPEHLRHYR